ncbi:tRNA (adenosine(37)-N6)-threonylcarbamoyltransferase complex ATPase subunit type 1 TsaE [Candidatus Curtissbacteria bacterium RIFCSPHIGHO2_01_FULL_41_44]|uniref:tRNA threonylcarbamoyladenosine biosynthesis protein TsaE n=1 Tax=Candidatus Curtissbacteria bacterium RIFCSPLOWO2_01_FULL_42_50 TaxID=1797730 RepID=A0A1F5H5R7_9BACT|nr:MAG: tRNA (adenosine(37)-N6)-threonylcarbamoyltransferase complex ATPase subunit type 1 TsaE [Candidatus Curtissbacteria bacterium RIFCSPHIGHO2_02_FULL_42_58]OGD94436.1 MAG: tRNA (adenosine(37)-N6)-threonylcarbamoyltransferase complex ATPase subunit type 1 TsaE [Candidatus Curtissbacteria bacterium RIFCSPHIGHO2_01_FULL_41_44]OGD97640.1 MAG: tRNA (adenosine(37)-N6)-threonylcarbamoyltransferase complex ATPase subunit type 1 TsaE [Candidatus Curtissbacteria bacterium RIFCSPHIGHO2_12_FULL_42_33]O
MEAKTTSPRQTQKIAQELGKTLKSGEVIALYGDLGVGKTVFVQGLAHGLGIKRRILSPTFVFMRSYPLILKGKPLTFYHLDLYRGQSMQDFKALGLDEIFEENSIVVLEWANKIKNILPKKRIDVFLKIIDEKTRAIEIKKY